MYIININLTVPGYSIQSITFIKRIIRGLESSGGLKTWRQFELFSFVSLDCEAKNKYISIGYRINDGRKRIHFPYLVVTSIS